MLGADLLGLGHKNFPAKLAAQTLPKGIAIGCFAETFGDAIPKLRVMLKTGKFSAVRVHLFWWTDLPGMKSHQIISEKRLKELAPKYEKLAKEFPAVKFYLSHSCEHNERADVTVRKRMNMLKKLAPSCIPVNSIWTGLTLPAEINEKHYKGTKFIAKGRLIVSNDGFDALEPITMAERHPKAELCFFWLPIFNLRRPGEPAPPPKDRKLLPTKTDFIQIADTIRILRGN